MVAVFTYWEHLVHDTILYFTVSTFCFVSINTKSPPPPFRAEHLVCDAVYCCTANTYSFFTQPLLLYTIVKTQHMYSYYCIINLLNICNSSTRYTGGTATHMPRRLMQSAEFCTAWWQAPWQLFTTQCNDRLKSKHHVLSIYPSIHKINNRSICLECSYFIK